MLSSWKLWWKIKTCLADVAWMKEDWKEGKNEGTMVAETKITKHTRIKDTDYGTTNLSQYIIAEKTLKVLQFISHTHTCKPSWNLISVTGKYILPNKIQHEVWHGSLIKKLIPIAISSNLVQYDNYDCNVLMFQILLLCITYNTFWQVRNCWYWTKYLWQEVFIHYVSNCKSFTDINFKCEDFDFVINNFL